jgi:zinc transporter 7
MRVGLWVLAGLGAFLCVEKLVRIARGDEDDGHAHSHSAPSKQATKAKKSDIDSSDESAAKKQKSKKSMDKEHKEEHVDQPQQGMAVAGYLNLAADFAHNFTDGLAVGASFLAGSSYFISIIIN